MPAMAPPAELAEEIAKRCDAEPDDVLAAAEAKSDELNGLVQGESAVILVGKTRFNVDLVLEMKDEYTPELDIENIREDMSDVTLECELARFGSPFSFGDDPDDKGWELTLRDDTGEITLMVWGAEQIDPLHDKLSGGQTVEVTGAYAKIYEGELQLNLGDDGDITVVDEAGVNEDTVDLT